MRGPVVQGEAKAGGEHGWRPEREQLEGGAGDAARDERRRRARGRSRGARSRAGAATAERGGGELTEEE